MKGDIMKTKKDGNVYIYNPEQANFYISKGVNPESTGIHPKTRRVWYKFDYNKTLEVYSEWCNRKKSLK